MIKLIETQATQDAEGLSKIEETTKKQSKEGRSRVTEKKTETVTSYVFFQLCELIAYKL